MAVTVVIKVPCVDVKSVVGICDVGRSPVARYSASRWEPRSILIEEGQQREPTMSVLSVLPPVMGCDARSWGPVLPPRTGDAALRGLTTVGRATGAPLQLPDRSLDDMGRRVNLYRSGNCKHAWKHEFLVARGRCLGLRNPNELIKFECVGAGDSILHRGLGTQSADFRSWVAIGAHLAVLRDARLNASSPWRVGPSIIHDQSQTLPEQSYL